MLESLGGELAALVEGASEPPPVADGAIEADNVLVDAGNDVGPIDFFSGASTHPIAMALHDMFLGLFVTPALLDDFADFVDNEVNFPPENTEAENLALILATFPIFATMPQDGVDFFFAFAQSMEHGAGAGFSVRNQPADGSGVEDMDSTVPGGNADLSGFDSVPGPNPIVYTLLNEPVFGEVFALNGSALNHLSAGETFSEGDTLIWLYGLEELASFQYPDNGPLLDPNLDGFVPIPGLPTYSGPLSDFTPFDFDGMNSLPDDLLGEINFSTPIAAVSLNAHFAGLNATWAAYNTNGTATFEDDTLVASGVLVGSVNAAWPTGFEYNDYFLVDPAGDLLFDRVVVTVADDSVTGGQETFGHFHDNGILVAAPSVTFQYQVSDGVNSDIGTVQIDVGLVPIEFATV